MPIVIKVFNGTSYISGDITDEFFKGLRKELGYKPESARFIISKNSKSKPWMKNWDGIISTLHFGKKSCRCFEKKNGLHFPTGLLSVAREYCQTFSDGCTVVDCRDPVDRSNPLGYQLAPGIAGRPYQNRVVSKAIRRQRGIIQACTGAGKTFIAAKMIRDIGVGPVIFFVPSIDLLEQSASEFSRFLTKDGKPITAGKVGGGNKTVSDVTVMTVQTAIRALDIKYQKSDDEDVIEKDDISDIKDVIKELLYNAQVVFFDECQHCAASTCQTLSDVINSARYRYGLSATPYRDLNDDILIQGCFGKTIDKISASELIEQGFLVKPEIYFVKIKNNISCPKSSYSEIYKHSVIFNEKRNDYIASMATKLYENGKNILVLCKNLDHGEILKSKIPHSHFLSGQSKKTKRVSHIENMRNERFVTIATSIFDEGIDVKLLDALILAGSGKSATRALQRIGRVIRPYPDIENNVKDTALVIDFLDDAKYLKDHSQRRKSIYKTEPLFEIKNLEI